MRSDKKDFNIQVGVRLKNARENGGYTQENFAETLNISVEHYRKIESGAYGLQPEKMLTLYDTYKIDPTCLITGQQTKDFDLDLFLANCSRVKRDAFLERTLLYMKKLMTGQP